MAGVFCCGVGGWFFFFLFVSGVFLMGFVLMQFLLKVSSLLTV